MAGLIVSAVLICILTVFMFLILYSIDHDYMGDKELISDIRQKIIFFIFLDFLVFILEAIAVCTIFY